MTVNILRMAARVQSIDHLLERQWQRMAQRVPDADGSVLYTFTRNVPKRIDELVDGGSIYWVIKRFVRVRQSILGIEPITNAEGRRRCRIQLDPVPVRTELYPHKAFQGWRYLRPEDAPRDLESGDVAEEQEEIPPEMAAELRHLGLL